MAEEERLLLALEDTSRTGVRVASLRMLAAGAGLVVSIVIARALGPTGRGLYALPVAFLGVVMAFSHVGLEGSNVYLAGTGVPLRRLWAVGTAGALIVSALAWIVVATIGMLAGAGFAAGLPVSWIVIAMAQLPLLLMVFYWTSVLQIEGMFAAAAWATVAGTLANGAAVLLLAAVGELTPFRVLALTWVTCGVTWVLVLRLGLRSGVAGLRPDPSVLLRAVSFGLRAQLATVFAFLVLRVDQVLVQGVLGFRALGIYAISVVIAELLWLVTDPFAASLVPHQVRAAGGDERRLGYATARLSLVAAGALCCATWALAPYAIRFAFGDAFVDATWPVRWLLPGVVAIAAQRPLYAIVTKEGRMGLAAAMNAGALAVNVVLTMLTLTTVGVVGAAIASTVTYLGLGAGYVLATRRPGVVGWGDLVPRRNDLLLLIAGVDRRPADRDAGRVRPEPDPVRATCPLCGATDGSRVASVPYRSIWDGLRSQWDAAVADDVIARHQPGADADFVRCARCGLDHSPGAIAGDSDFYEQLMANTPYHTDRWEFQIVLPHIEPGLAVADMGCGEGAFVRLASTRAARAVGVDHNYEAIRTLVDAGFEGSSSTFQEFSRREGAAFDVVCSFHTLEHLAEPLSAACAMRSLLRPGGRIFLSLPNRDRFGRRDDEPLDCPPHHLTRWGPHQLAELADQLDLRLAATHFEEPDLSHARLAAGRSSRLLQFLGANEGGLPARAWMRAVVGPRKYRRALARGEYQRRGIVGHSMLAEFELSER
jgi:O-antigen/teichoic acid export membrane protein/2-polyprenyl-3-methyl-5-hydroxy-6-metoxy-1,4-benzoquinol methylase